jgi:hypothetical protein
VPGLSPESAHLGGTPALILSLAFPVLLGVGGALKEIKKTFNILAAVARITMGAGRGVVRRVRRKSYF